MTMSGCPIRASLRPLPASWQGFAAALYGCTAYGIFLFTFLYAVGFVGNFLVPKSIDSGGPIPLVETLLVDLVLLGLFAVQHSGMARPGFKRQWTRLVPEPIERATYVLLASAILLLLFWQWRPLAQPVWSIEQPLLAGLVQAVFWFGWALVLASTFLINHFELFGLRQVFAFMAGRRLPPPTFHIPLLYRLIRHPIYLGFLMAFWATPEMTLGHLLFAVGTTGYILIGIQLEERDLVAVFGQPYRTYRQQVGMLLPSPRRRPVTEPVSSISEPEPGFS
jgi:protein-S-isoprenylcysteine O-methyltransferase Ste14